MREILFRGKRKTNNEYVRGYLYRISKNLTPFIRASNGVSYAVGLETVGEYTKKKDINDIEIFEGDIVRYNINGNYYKVEYVADGWYGFCFIDLKTGECYSIAEFDDITVVGDICDCEVVEVTGNIHDNSELLEVE